MMTSAVLQFTADEMADLMNASKSVHIVNDDLKNVVRLTLDGGIVINLLPGEIINLDFTNIRHFCIKTVISYKNLYITALEKTQPIF